MMSSEPRLACALAQDLLIPYVSGEVSEVTRRWVEQHLHDCADCKGSYEASQSDAAPVALVTEHLPPADPGRKLLRRVRLTLLGLLTLILLLAVGVAGLSWTIMKARQVANVPVGHLVPRAELSALKAVEADLSSLGLRLTSTSPSALQAPGFVEGATANYETANGELIQVAAYRFETAEAALRHNKNWFNGFGIRTLSFSTQSRGEWVAKFRSGGHFYYGWSAGEWAIRISVPNELSEAANLRDQIRDALFVTYGR